MGSIFDIISKELGQAAVDKAKDIIFQCKYFAFITSNEFIEKGMIISVLIICFVFYMLCRKSGPSTLTRLALVAAIAISAILSAITAYWAYDLFQFTKNSPQLVNALIKLDPESFYVLVLIPKFFHGIAPGIITLILFYSTPVFAISFSLIWIAGYGVSYVRGKPGKDDS